MLTTSEIQKLLKEARQKVSVGSFWRHKKGGVYRVLGHGFDTELARIDVHYHRVGGPDYNPREEYGIIFDRPLFMWTDDRFTRMSPKEVFENGG